MPRTAVKVMNGLRMVLVGIRQGSREISKGFGNRIVSFGRMYSFLPSSVSCILGNFEDASECGVRSAECGMGDESDDGRSPSSSGWYGTILGQSTHASS